MLAALLVLQPGESRGQGAGPGHAPAAADRIADFFGSVGDQIFEECIFELSAEQIEVQQALIQAYVAQGATPHVARQLAVKQIAQGGCDHHFFSF